MQHRREGQGRAADLGDRDAADRRRRGGRGGAGGVDGLGGVDGRGGVHGGGPAGRLRGAKRVVRGPRDGLQDADLTPRDAPPAARRSGRRQRRACWRKTPRSAILSGL
ncbi:MAG: hypothetical protein GC159_22095 [Phycisphaera sp.]|nr:hypothetical protein [Phycisphaera sp.]